MFDKMTVSARAVYEHLEYPPDAVRDLITAADSRTARFHFTHTRDGDKKLFMAMLGPRQVERAIDAAGHLTVERRTQLKRDFAAHPMMQPSALYCGPCIVIYELTPENVLANDDERDIIRGGNTMYCVAAAQFAAVALCTATVPSAVVYPVRSWHDAEQLMARYYRLTGTELAPGSHHIINIFGRGLARIMARVEQISMIAPPQKSWIEYPREALVAEMIPVIDDAALDAVLEADGEFVIFSMPQ